VTPYILATGLCTPLGLDAEANRAEFLAGSNRFSESDVLDKQRLPIRASLATPKWTTFKRWSRMGRLAHFALRDCLQQVESKRPASIPLFLGLPTEKSGGIVDETALLKVMLKGMPEGNIQVPPENRFRLGRASFFYALEAACRHLQTTTQPVLVGGIDSLCDRTSLTYLSLLGRNLGPTNSDGILPGEAAGFVLLSRELPVNAKSRPRIAAWSTSKEPRHFQQGEPNLGEGLSAAFRSLRTVADSGKWRPDHLMSCQTGERFWAQEFSTAYMRNASLMPEPLRGNLVAEWLGDVGAASGAVLMAAAEGWMAAAPKVLGQPKRVLVYGSSDQGSIGACVVEGCQS
jgi:3-oxoacyl-[acyl-carrier-protein] synthase-1